MAKICMSFMEKMAIIALSMRRRRNATVHLWIERKANLIP